MNIYCLIHAPKCSKNKYLTYYTMYKKLFKLILNVSAAELPPIKNSVRAKAIPFHLFYGLSTLSGTFS